MRDNRILISLLLMLSHTLAIACMVENVANTPEANPRDMTAQPEPTPPPKQIDPEILKLSAPALCARLGETKVIDSRKPEESDDVYRALVVKDSEALPCLVDKIADRKLMHDPRMAPVWQHYTIGDTAVFTILDIVSKGDYEVWKELFLGPLPQKYKEEWRTNGVYAYFNYVSEPRDRKALQGFWKNRLNKRK